MTAQDSRATTFADIMDVFNQALEFQTFAELGRKPNIKPVVVVACFADIRGFTQFVSDTKSDIQVAAEFLSDFFLIFPRAVLREVWELKQDDPQTPATIFQESVRRLIIPTLAKKLGDGMLLVWELCPPVEKDVRKGVPYAILDVIGYLQEYFYRLVEETQSQNPLIHLKLDFGIGLAGGNASKLDYGSPGQIDYSGPPLNLAARLQDLARPGVVVDARFASHYLLERAWTGEGRVEPLEVKGINEPVPVWVSTSRKLMLRRPRNIKGASVSPLADLNQIKALLDPPYLERPPQGSDKVGRVGFCPEDMRTLMEIREDFEASFAAEAAERITANPSGQSPLWDSIQKMESSVAKEEFRAAGQNFHEAIARLSGGEDRVGVVRFLHEWTTKIYPQTSTDRAEMVREHTEIAQAISNGSQSDASQKMHDHLRQHHNRVKKEVFYSLAVQPPEELESLAKSAAFVSSSRGAV